ncbi:recombination protein NinG [Sphaerochaeta sp. PS]|uniref:recombination protein NinG n=1 Tax=Sphaerochaeta sp. PS TaxID=3076336 RepID=UPI0028A313FA|nr:recombination protein NinG [Sphaerochaeta sp. PS]MDT4761838.1 recombination protein NinG [Sphaerochaeta sp. PS]
MKFHSKAKPREKALTAFQKLRRYQAATPNGYVKCISCGKLMNVKEAQGGHLVSRRVRATELEPDNVWPQCPRCNGPLSGNVIAYRSNLVKLIGVVRVQRIEDLANASEGDEEAYQRLSGEDRRSTVRKRTEAEYEALASGFRAQTRILQKEKVS